MDKQYGLSSTEYEIMEYLWSVDNPVLFKDILIYFNSVQNKKWKKQTLGTYLKILQNKNLIMVDMFSPKYKYKAVYSKEQYMHDYAVEICKKSFDNSIGKFVAAFSGNEKLDLKSVEELRDYLKQYDE